MRVNGRAGLCRPGADTATFSGSSGDNPTVTLDVSPTIASTTINGGNWTFTNGVLTVGDLKGMIGGET